MEILADGGSRLQPFGLGLSKRWADFDLNQLRAASHELL
jgi:hypothetical protein